jgi:hypothetical protein
LEVARTAHGRDVLLALRDLGLEGFLVLIVCV